ncbi:hypothetical protein WMY93_025000 [Mugilogobius chulae]|uniref:Uncharacterized protein n=1 Tax=Mugilogobius chulae TaxID=88201 RepID=A0AAW0N619_9GOBI
MKSPRTVFWVHGRKHRSQHWNQRERWREQEKKVITAKKMYERTDGVMAKKRSVENDRRWQCPPLFNAMRSANPARPPLTPLRLVRGQMGRRTLSRVLTAIIHRMGRGHRYLRVKTGQEQAAGHTHLFQERVTGRGVACPRGSSEKCDRAQTLTPKTRCCSNGSQYQDKKYYTPKSQQEKIAKPTKSGATKETRYRTEIEVKGRSIRSQTRA